MIVRENQTGILSINILFVCLLNVYATHLTIEQLWMGYNIIKAIYTITIETLQYEVLKLEVNIIKS